MDLSNWAALTSGGGIGTLAEVIAIGLVAVVIIGVQDLTRSLSPVACAACLAACTRNRGGFCGARSHLGSL